MPNKTSTEHYDAAEKLLEEAESYHDPGTRAEWCLALAKMHLAMSQASIAKEALELRMKASARTKPDVHGPERSSLGRRIAAPGGPKKARFGGPRRTGRGRDGLPPIPAAPAKTVEDDEDGEPT